MMLVNIIVYYIMGEFIVLGLFVDKFIILFFNYIGIVIKINWLDLFFCFCYCFCVSNFIFIIIEILFN